MLEQDEDFKGVPQDTACLIKAISGAKFEIPEKEERIDMCYAVRDYLLRETSQTVFQIPPCPAVSFTRTTMFCSLFSQSTAQSIRNANGLVSCNI